MVRDVRPFVQVKWTEELDKDKKKSPPDDEPKSRAEVRRIEHAKKKRRKTDHAILQG